MAEPYPAGLDPAHIMAVCEYATGGRHALAVGTGDSLCVCLPSRQAARSSAVALTRVGYRVAGAPGSHGRNVLVRGWDPAGLEARLAAMRTVLHQLGSDRVMAARAALTPCPGGPPVLVASPALAERARAELRRWVFTRSGVHAARDPAIEPPDLAAALRLRATVPLEQAIDDLVQRQLRVAGHAVTLYGSLRPRMDELSARAAAIRWASITFHLPGSFAPDSPDLIRAAAEDRSPRPLMGPRALSPPGAQPVRSSDLRLPGPAGGNLRATDTAAAPVVPIRRSPSARRPRQAR